MLTTRLPSHPLRGEQNVGSGCDELISVATINSKESLSASGMPRKHTKLGSCHRPGRQTTPGY